MIKKFKAISILSALSLVLCGCSMKTEYNMTINKDKSMDFSVIAAMDKELIDGLLSMENMSIDGEENENTENVEYTDEQRWQMLEKQTTEDESPKDLGFTEEKYQENEYYGYKYTKKISNIDDISGNKIDFKLEDFKNISDSKFFVKDGNTYKAKFTMSNEEQSEQTQGYDVGIDMIFTVTLPDKPISHNATETSEDGKTLIWNLLDKDSQNIEFEFSLNEENNNMLYVVCGLIGIVTVGVFATIFVFKNKSKEDIEE